MISHSSQAALSEKTMKVINCELTSEDALSINSILFISILSSFSSAAFIFCSSIVSCNCQFYPIQFVTSTKMHKKCIKSEKICRQKVLHEPLPSWSHACILRKRTSPLQRQFDDYKENNSFHCQKFIFKNIFPCLAFVELTILIKLLMFWVSSALREDEGDVQCTKSPSNPPPEISTGLNCFQAGPAQKNGSKSLTTSPHFDQTFPGRDGMRSDCFEGGFKTTFHHLLGKNRANRWLL